MAGGPGSPVALIRVYVQHGKLEEAGQLALKSLRRWLYGVQNFTEFLLLLHIFSQGSC